MQLVFFNHFINKRVHLITGATGTGKSVIVPKLICYGYNCYYYKNNWKVAATQPRIPPTINTGKFISEMIGYPMLVYNEIQKEKVLSQNTLIQYDSKDEKFIGKSKQKRYLKIMTDGLLYNVNLKNNLLLKENDGKNYYQNNLFDSIIIDEAHEHNANMDMILTLMRNCCYWNNSIKLFIVSATIDEDEHRYRYYYHFINDLYRYPLVNKIGLEINSNLLDMRIDISSPGKTTQYKIDDYYGKNI
jgi:HrpA-like RNA helicase